MIPSRGLRWSSQTISTGRRRIETFSVRQFSSNVRPIRSNALLSRKNTSILRPKINLPFSRTNLLIRNGASIRFASTTPLPTGTTPGGPADAVSSSAASPQVIETSSLDSATDFSSWPISEIPESIGYLKSLGLEYGNGPTALMEWVLEHIHVYAGTPWWLSITLTAIVVRAVIFRAYIAAAENGAKMQAILPITKPISDQMTQAFRNQDNDAVQRLRAELSRINARAGIKYWKSFPGPLAQAMAGFGTFILLRAMSKLPVPGLETGGILWFSNLAIPDPYFIFPFATAGILHWVLRKGGEMGTTNMTTEMQKAMMWGFPALSLGFTWWLPASVQLSFFVAGLLSWGQATLLRQTWFRDIFKMTPLPIKPAGPTGPAPPAPTPYKGTLKRAANPGPLSTTELSQRFEGAANRGALQKTVGKIRDMEPPASPAKRILNIAPLKAVKSTVDEIKDAGKGMFDKAKEYKANSDSKSAIAERKKYEEKRQAELKKQQRERDDERRAQRAARLANKNK